MNNPFHENQKVVCIDKSFPAVITTAEDKSILGKPAPNQPKEGEILVIDEILGDYLRFDKYDDNDPQSPQYSTNWWHHSRFAPINEMEIEEEISDLKELLQVIK